MNIKQFNFYMGRKNKPKNKKYQKAKKNTYTNNQQKKKETQDRDSTYTYTTYEKNTSNKKQKNKNERNNEPNKPKGLDNLGFSCYMNSILQCFFHIKKLREYLISERNTFGTDKPVCKALAEIMDKLKNGKEKSFRPEKFKKIMGEKNNLFSGRKPGDVKDLFINLIDVLLSELNDTHSEESPEEEEVDLYDKEAAFKETQKENDEKNIINQLFCGYYETIYTCPNKNKEIYSFQYESFILFELEKIKNNLNIEGNLSLNSCFEYYNKEIPKTSFYCGLCEKIQENKCQNKIYRPPEILVIILDRGKGKKFEEKVDFETKINLTELTEIDENDYKYNTSYKLIGISTHSGDSSAKGHYTACCLNDKDDYYYYFSDDYVKKIDDENELYDDEPYLLFYQREEDDNNQNNNNNEEEEDIIKEDKKEEKENLLNQIEGNKNKKDEDEDEDNYNASEENKNNDLNNKKEDVCNSKKKNNNSNMNKDYAKIIDDLKIEEKDNHDTHKKKGRHNKNKNINSNNNINKNPKNKNKNNNINNLNNNKNNNLLKKENNKKNDDPIKDISIDIKEPNHDNKKKNNNNNKSISCFNYKYLFLFKIFILILTSIRFDNIDIIKNKEIKDIENEKIGNLFYDEQVLLIDNVLNLFMERKNDKYIVDYNSSENKNPLIWKLSLNADKKIRYKNKEKNFIIDFSQLKFKDLTSITTTESKRKLQLYKYEYVHKHSFYNNMKHYFNYIINKYLKKRFYYNHDNKK